MTPTIHETFVKSDDFSFRNNLFYQSNFQGSASFEDLYIDIRRKEDRLYSDEAVKLLPRLAGSHPLSAEWRRRAFTSRRLISYLNSGNRKNILEVGCGNGWFCHQLARLPHTQVAGIDVNETELLQAARLFGQVKNLTLIHGNILQGLPFKQFDHIILLASLQYFDDASHLLGKLFGHLSDDGQIHIADTPLYSPSSALKAARRSAEYFARSGAPEMKHHYHHHTLEAIALFKPRVIYDPGTFLNKLRRKFAFASPFPWIIINRAPFGSTPI